jgi:hypothetical protein
LLPSRPNPAETQKPKIRHTGVSWPDGQDRPRIETAIKDIVGVGYHGLETFGDVLDRYEKGGITPYWS